MTSSDQPIYQGENVPAWQAVRHANGTIGPACTCGTHVPDPACKHPTHTTYRSWTPGDMDRARATVRGTIQDRPRHPGRCNGTCIADGLSTDDY